MKRVLLFFLLFFFYSSYTFAQHYAFYGITGAGGKYNDGLIYRYDPLTGQYDTLHSISPTEGIETWAGLTLANNGLLYGTTEAGGKYNDGTMFSFNRINNTLQVLINFDSLNTGRFDASSNNIMQGKNGLLYGVTEAGGYGDGGVFYSYNITTGKDSVLFCFDTLNMSTPNGPIIEDTSTGYLYGTTEHGGPKDFGAIYRYNPKTNKDTVLFHFDTTGGGGIMPVASTFSIATNGILYGMTPYGGGEHFGGTLYSFNIGTFKDSTLLQFTGINGSGPWVSNLMQASNNFLYGMTIAGGSYSDGVLFCFDITTNTQTILLNFNGTNGNEPVGNLVQDPDNGKLYGITNTGGKYNMGVLFCYDIKTGKDSVCINFDGVHGAYPVREPTLVWDTAKVDSVTALNGLQSKNYEVKVFPNPSNGIFALTLPSPRGEGVTNLQVYNMLGEKVYAASLNPSKGGISETTVDLSSQPDGIYMLRITDAQGTLLKAGKLVIMH